MFDRLNFVRVRLLVALMMLCGAATILAPVSQATPQAPAQAPTMIVLDASGSMANADADALGTTRMEAAKSAARDVFASVGAASPLGLVVYGSSVPEVADEREAGCADIKVIAAPRTGPVEALSQGIDAVTASGYTPIGNSLKVAAEQLPDSRGSIVPVSDGIDTCAPPPACEVAGQLRATGLDVTVHTIGFKVDDEARAELQCIAAATGGTYADAGDAATLTQQLKTQVTRGISAYDVQGTPVSGGLTWQDAVSIEPGQYVDAIRSTGTSEFIALDSAEQANEETYRWYRVHLDEGERLHVAASVIVPQEAASPVDKLDLLRLRVGSCPPRARSAA